MPEYTRYVAHVKSQDHRGRAQPDPAALLDAWRAMAGEVHPPVRTRRLVAALVSFVDDFDGPFAEEAFDDRAVRRCLDWLGATTTGVTLPEIAAVCQKPSFLETILVTHAALRQLARGRDDRALPSCRMSLDERLQIGRHVLPFAPDIARGGDPLGDAYHYCANLAAGCLLSPSWRAWPVPLFAVGPELMSGVRQGLFGSTLFCGNHARVDRLGLVHGMRVSLKTTG
jgi:hypothetical protein